MGLNQRSKVSPIRPQFIFFATDLSREWENKLLAAEWKAFTPHTVRRGSVTCSGCHESPRRYLLEADADRLHLLDKDGLALRSFWSQTGQTVTNGSFFPLDRHTLMNRKTPEYVRQYLTMAKPARSRRTALEALILSLLGGFGLWRFLTPRGKRSSREEIKVRTADVPADGALVLPRKRCAVVKSGNSIMARDLICPNLGCTVNTTAWPENSLRSGPTHTALYLFAAA